MTIEFISPDIAVSDGDVTSPYDLPEAEIPEDGITSELIEGGIADAERTTKEARVRELLLLAYDASEAAKARGVHQSTRTALREEAKKYLDQAHQLIADLHGLDPHDVSEGLMIVPLRARYRNEALGLRDAAEREKRVRSRIGGRAVDDNSSGATPEEPYSDGRMRAAEGSARSPWNQD